MAPICQYDFRHDIVVCTVVIDSRLVIIQVCCVESIMYIPQEETYHVKIYINFVVSNLQVFCNNTKFIIVELAFFTIINDSIY